MKTEVRLACILAAALLLLCTAALVFDGRGQLPDSRYPPMAALIISECGWYRGRFAFRPDL